MEIPIIGKCQLGRVEAHRTRERQMRGRGIPQGGRYGRVQIANGLYLGWRVSHVRGVKFRPGATLCLQQESSSSSASFQPIIAL